MDDFSRVVFRLLSLRKWTIMAALCAAMMLQWGTAHPVQGQDAAGNTPPVVEEASAQPAGEALASSLYLPFASSFREPAPLCRMGVNLTSWTTPAILLDSLRTGWYIDYHAVSAVPHPNGGAHMPVINLTQIGSDGFISKPSGAALDSAIAANPGADWIIGNEPDRRYYQNDLEPHVYARAFHDMTQYIRAKDPTARFFAGAIVQPTPLRLRYLDLVLSSHWSQFGQALPADGWAIHNFILNERSCSHYNDPYICWGADIPPGIDATDGLVIGLDELKKTADFEFFKQQIVRFRQWMADNNYRNLPLYVSEYGILMPEDRGFPPALVNQYMKQTFDYMLATRSDALGYPADNNRLVQRFAWYSILDPSFNGSLFESTTDSPVTPPFRLTEMGKNYVSYTSSMQATGDFKLLGLAQLPLPAASGNAVSVTLRTSFANAGNNQWPAGASLHFYLGDPSAGGVLIGSKGVSLTGCGRTGSVDFVWANAPPEANGQRVYVRLQSGDTMTQTSVQIVLANSLLYLPQAKQAQ